MGDVNALGACVQFMSNFQSYKSLLGDMLDFAKTMGVNTDDSQKKLDAMKWDVKTDCTSGAAPAPTKAVKKPAAKPAAKKAAPAKKPAAKKPAAKKPAAKKPAAKKAAPAKKPAAKKDRRLIFGVLSQPGGVKKPKRILQ